MYFEIIALLVVHIKTLFFIKYKTYRIERATSNWCNACMINLVYSIKNIHYWVMYRSWILYICFDCCIISIPLFSCI